MSWLKNKEVRTFVAALILVVLIIGLIGYLTFIQVPEGNKDIIVTIIGSFTGSIGVAVAIMLGTEKNTEEMHEMASKIDRIEGAHEELRFQFDDFKDRLLELNKYKK